MATDLDKGFRLGPWHVHPQLGSLTGPNGDHHLEPKVMDVLVTLAQARGELVTRDQLLQSVWGERAFSEEPLTRAIGELRRALGDSPREPTYIETVPKRGYRLLAEVTAAAPAADRSAAPATASQSNDAPGVPALWRRPGFIVGALLAVAVAYVMVDRLLLEGFDAAPTIAVPERPTVAVLPFCNVGGADEDAYFSAGVTEDLTTLLAKSPELIVASRNAATALGCQPDDLGQVGAQLAARYLVTGSTRIATDNRMRLTVEFTDTQLDRVVWADTYDREFSPASLFSTQSEIAEAIARSLELRVMTWEGAAPTQDPTAWSLYARGRFLARNPVARGDARALLRQAIELDPGLASAHAYLGQTYTMPSGLAFDPDERKRLVEQGEIHIRRALTVDPTNHVGQTHLGFIHHIKGQPDSAINQARRAVETVPNYDVAWFVQALGWMQKGNAREAMNAFNRGLKLNPNPPPGIWGPFGTVHYVDKDVPRAVELWERTRSTSPGAGSGQVMLVNHYQSVGRHEEAKAAAAEILARYPRATAEQGVAFLALRLHPDWMPEQLEENLRAAGLP